MNNFGSDWIQIHSVYPLSSFTMTVLILISHRENEENTCEYSTLTALCNEYFMLHFLLHWQIANLEKDTLPVILRKKNTSEIMSLTVFSDNFYGRISDWRRKCSIYCSEKCYLLFSILQILLGIISYLKLILFFVLLL